MSVKLLQEELKALDEEYTKNVQTVFKRAIKPLFDQYPNVSGVSWLQYTPYFCDGDPCYFGVYADLYYGLSIDFDGKGYEDYENLMSYRKDDIDDDVDDDMELKKMFQYFEAFLYAFDAEQLQKVVPDEGRVYLTRDGVMTVESYAHD